MAEPLRIVSLHALAYCELLRLETDGLCAVGSAALVDLTSRSEVGSQGRSQLLCS